MKRISKKILIAILSFVILSALIVISVLLFLNKMQSFIAFYDVPTNVSNSIIKQIDQITKTFEKPFKYQYLYLDPTEQLNKQIKDDDRIILVFSWNGKPLEDLSDKIVIPSKKLFNMTSSSIKEISSTSLPILLNSFEALYSSKNKNFSNLVNVNHIIPLINGAKTNVGKSHWPLILAGGDNENLGMMITSLIESILNPEAANHFFQLLEQLETFDKDSFDTIIDTELADCGKNARFILDTLFQWKQDGLLHPMWYELTKSEVSSLLEMNISDTAFIPLSIHRVINSSIITKFNDSFFPYGNVTDKTRKTRSLCINVLTSSVLVNKNQKTQDIAILLQKMLIQPDVQARISQETGLAPTNSTADTVDRQASNARFWAASASSLLPDISKAFKTSTDCDKFFALLRNYLAVGL